MTREFIKLGHQAYLITSVFNDGIQTISPATLREVGGFICSEDTELGIPVIRVDSYIARWPPRRIVFRDFIAILEKIVEKFQLDVLITHSTLWNGPEEVAKFVEWRRDMKRVGGYYDPLVFCHMSHFQEPSPKRYSITERSFRVAWNKLTLPQIFSAANIIIAVTPLEKKAKVKMGANPDQVLLFPGGVDDDSFLSCANLDFSPLLKEFNIREDAKIVSYVGSIEERKNPLAVLKIAQRLRNRKDLHFVLAGRGDSAYAQEFVEEAKKLSNVTYLGEVDQQKKVLLMKASFVNILMSRSEALGITQLEFMHCGVPVVTSAVEGQAWVVRNGLDGIHVNGPDDIAGAAAALEKIADNQELRDRLSENAARRADDFSMTKLTADLDKALTKELLKERGLLEVPSEARDTISVAETVLKSWYSGSWSVVATTKRMFIRKGIISRKVLEIPYSTVSSIEYMRRYSWKTLAAGLVLSFLILIWPSLEPIFSKAFLELIAPIESLFQSSIAIAFLSFLPAIPIVVALIVFAYQARTGFTLRGLGLNPVYLPSEFKEAIAFIRNAQNQNVKLTSPERAKGYQ